MSQHSLYHYSITLSTDDEAVLHCLRALSQYAQKSGNVRIPWGGTKRPDWKRNNHKAKFHFSDPGYRKVFRNEIERIIPSGLWKFIGENDNDPAEPQNED